MTLTYALVHGGWVVAFAVAILSFVTSIVNARKYHEMEQRFKQGVEAHDRTLRAIIEEERKNRLEFKSALTQIGYGAGISTAEELGLLARQALDRRHQDPGGHTVTYKLQDDPWEAGYQAGMKHARESYLTSPEHSDICDVARQYGFCHCEDSPRRGS